MNNIYFLQIMCDFEKEIHYENVYSKKDIAFQEGIKKLEELFRDEYKSMFGKDEEKNILELDREELFNLQAIYDFTITEYNPEYVDSLNNINNLPIIQDLDIYDLYLADLKPAKIIHSFDYNGKQIYISAVYIFNYNGKRREKEMMMYYEDYINSKAGTKFEVGDIVKIKSKTRRYNDYHYIDKLHVITDVPHKKSKQKFFNNTYRVIVNHNSYDEGCHIDVFNENDLELYTGELPYDSPLVFLSKYFKRKIKLKNISWLDIECGKITLNENRSFRDIPEIMNQLRNKEGEKENENWI